MKLGEYKYDGLYKEWSDLYNSGMSPYKIAKSYSVSRTTVAAGLNRSGAVLRRASPSEKAQSEYMKSLWKDPEYSTQFKKTLRIRCAERRTKKEHDVLSEGYKTCACCNEYLPIDEFRKRKASSDGHSCYCNSCNYDKTKAYRKRHPKKVWATSVIASHRQRGLKSNFTIKELEDFVNGIEVCGICGVRLDWATQKTASQSNSPSIDRIDNAPCLTLDNIRVVCHRCNTTKGPRTMKEFVDYCRMVAERFGALS